MKSLMKNIYTVLALSIFTAVIALDLPAFAELGSSPVRYDFISDLEGMSKAGAVIDSIESTNGACVLTTTDGAIKNQMVQLILPKTDLGDGGYYMYAKIKYTTPSQEQLKMVNCVYESSGAWIVAEQKDSPKWQDYDILKFDTSTLSGEQDLRLRIQFRGSEPNGIAQIYIDWIVFSKDPQLTDNTGIILSLSDGIQNIPLSQNGDLDSVEINEELYNSLGNGIFSGLPMGFTAELAEGIGETEYSVAITDKNTYKLADISVKAFINDEVKIKDYRIVFTTVRSPLELKSDIRFDFFSDMEGTSKSGGVVASADIQDGACVLTTIDGAIKSQVVELVLPQIDLGEGGYYMYVRAKYETPSQEKINSVYYSYSPSGSGYTATASAADTWKGYSIIKFDTSELKDEQYLKLTFKLRGAEPDGVAKVYIDWITLTKTPSLNADTALLNNIVIDDVEYTLPQDGDVLNLNMNTSHYMALEQTESGDFPDGWAASFEENTNHTVDFLDKNVCKITDIIVSDINYCRTYRIAAYLRELELITSKGTIVTVPGAINISKNGEHSYTCDMYPEAYDLLKENDISVSTDEYGEIAMLSRNSDSLMVTVSDSDNETFRLECTKIKSDNIIKIGSISFNNGKLTCIGMVTTADGTAYSGGSVSVAAFDKTASNVRAVASTDLDEDGRFSVELDVPESDDPEEYYSMKVGVYAKNTENIRNISYYTPTVQQRVVNEVISSDSGTNIYTDICESKYRDLFETMGIWTNLSVNDEKINGALKNQLSDINSKNFAEIVNGTIISQTAAEKNKIQTVELLTKYDKEIKPIIVSGKSFADLNDTEKSKVIEHLFANASTDVYGSWARFENAVKKSMLFYLISSSVEYKTVDKLILDNADVIVYPKNSINETSLETLKNASNEKADNIMRVLVNAQGNTMFKTSDELLSDLSAAIETVEKKSSSASSGGGGGGGGSYSSGGASRVETFTVGTGTMINPYGKISDSEKGNSEKDKRIFNDLSSCEWAEAEINGLYSLGVIAGTGSGMYEPSRNVTREEFVKMLCKAFDIEQIDSGISFTDVNRDDWFYNYVASAVGVGIVKGISEFEFGTGKMITREDMAVLIYRTTKQKGYVLNEDEPDFYDNDDISYYASEAIGTLSSAGIINGVGDNKFMPKAFASRAETAVIIYRCLNMQ